MSLRVNSLQGTRGRLGDVRDLATGTVFRREKKEPLALRHELARVFGASGVGVSARQGRQMLRLIKKHGLEPLEIPTAPVINETVITPGAFYYVYVKDVSGTDHNFLQGGTVTGGSATVTIDDIDLGSVASPSGSDGDHLFLKVLGDGIEDDDDEVLLPGFQMDVGGATVETPASTVPNNVIPTLGSLDGTCYIELGVWNGLDFLPSNKGNVHVTLCRGSFVILRS